jgi:uncharacterized membrane protein YkgB
MTAGAKPPINLEEKAREALPARLRRRFDDIDQWVARRAARLGVPLLRTALGIVFVWFGALKLIDRSPVEELVTETLSILPHAVALYGMGALELFIGLGLLIPVALRLVLLVFWLMMFGTLASLAIAPTRAFQDGNPLLLTTEGEFIVKNLVLISAGIVIASTVVRRRLSEEDEAGQQAQPGPAQALRH